MTVISSSAHTPPGASSLRSKVDLFSEQARRNPYPYYRQLRDEQPVAFLEPLGWYAVTRHTDVERVLRSPDDFSSTIMRSADRTLLGQDPPAHTCVRRIVARELSARIRPLERWIETTARLLVFEFIKKKGGDFVRDIAVELPLRVIARLLGIDGSSRLAEFKEWSNAVVPGAGREISPGQATEIARRAKDFDDFFGELIRLRRERPGEDIVSALLQTPAIPPLQDDQTRGIAKLLLIAGNETTANLMSNALLAMFMAPGLQARLREVPVSCRAWVDETLRFDTPVQILLRRAQRDLALGDTHIPKGGVIAAILGSANRDERQHTEPDTFRLNRGEIDVSFGAGPHLCLGASLARLQATITLSILIEETRHIEPMESLDEIPRIPALQLRGLQRLLMTVS